MDIIVVRVLMSTVDDSLVKHSPYYSAQRAVFSSVVRRCDAL